MEFKACPVFKCLRAEGKKGIYFIEEGAWTYLTRIAPKAATPNVFYNECVGSYESVEDATKDAEEIDGAEDE